MPAQCELERKNFEECMDRSRANNAFCMVWVGRTRNVYFNSGSSYYLETLSSADLYEEKVIMLNLEQIMPAQTGIWRKYTTRTRPALRQKELIHPELCEFKLEWPILGSSFAFSKKSFPVGLNVLQTLYFSTKWEGYCPFPPTQICHWFEYIWYDRKDMFWT